ncbi:NAD(P)/FAD-dependent oxidoreductase [Kushneria aurantia]|uniref:NAD(P)/FAD-dependent oxidoreductase n=1 Tax=Kushneria aurantia TaxID=504092 RepID=A0ABV6FZ63_9GAMM|nr:tryptophan 7-halogenase [Kushneria aurantia]
MRAVDIDTDIAIIGAGPAGAVAAALLAERGRHVRVIEASHFPRFAIGESLLPQCLDDLQRSGLDGVIAAAGFQHKGGARFVRGAERVDIDFSDKSCAGPGRAWQVERADFDQRLIEAAAARGAETRFGERAVAFDADPVRPAVTIERDDGQRYRLGARLVLDASGFAQLLPRLEGTRSEAHLSARRALFSHLSLKTPAPGFQRDSIQIGLSDSAALWYWLIPFSSGRASLGFVGETSQASALNDGGDPSDAFRACLAQFEELGEWLDTRHFHRPVAALDDYSRNTRSLIGPGYRLLGNAGEFLDPIFSSGVTVAVRSACLAAPLIDRQLDDEAVDWQREWEQPLRRGIDVFRAFVEAWYDGRLPAIIFHPEPPDWLRRPISAVLAGYVWDTDNPFVARPRRHLDTLAALCGYAS